jgi:hypothetical protein
MVKYLVPTPSVSVILTRGRVAAMFVFSSTDPDLSFCLFFQHGGVQRKLLSVNKALLQIKKRTGLASL